MKSFDLEQLQSFIAAVDTGSLTAAAPLRCLSQSAISEQIRKLEQRANQTLLIRSKNGVLPTPAGEKLLVHARHLLALSEAAWHDLQGVSIHGEIHLGITDYCQPEDLVNILAHLSVNYPQLKLRTTIGKSAEIENAWKNHEIDIAIVMRLSYDHDSARKTHETLLLREPMLWVGSKPSEEKLLPLILLPEDCAIHQMAIKTLRNNHLSYFIRHIASGVKGLQSALSAGLGVTCINYSSIPNGWKNLGNLFDLPQLPTAEFVLLNGQGDNRQMGQTKLDFSHMLKSIFSAV